jgi:hypothetical protein
VTFEEHREKVLRNVRDQQRHLKRGESWSAVLLLETPTGDVVVELPVVGPESKTLIANSIRASNATFTGTVLPSTVTPEGQAPREGLLVLVGDVRRGYTEAWYAPIFRLNRKPPRLGAWEELKGQPHAPDSEG